MKLPHWWRDQPDRVMRSRSGWPFRGDEPVAFLQHGEPRAGGVPAQDTPLLKLADKALTVGDDREMYYNRCYQFFKICYLKCNAFSISTGKIRGNRSNSQFSSTHYSIFFVTLWNF